MTDTTFFFLFLLLALILLFQIALFGAQKSIRSLLEDALTKLDVARESAAVFRLATTEETLSRRVKFRATTDQLTAKVTTQGKQHAVIVEDISETGVLLHLENDAPLKMDETYPFALCLPDQPLLQASIRIVRIAESKNQLGACFVDLSIESKAAIRRYVQNLAKRDLTTELQQPPNR